MNLLTAMMFVGNYPDNILITSTEPDKDGKVSAFCYITKGGEIHTLLLSTQPVFNSKKEAEQYMHDLAEETKKILAERANQSKTESHSRH